MTTFSPGDEAVGRSFLGYPRGVGAGTQLRDGDLRLRPLRLPDDVEVALPWYRDPEVLHFSESGSAAYSANTVRAMFESLARQGEVFIIEVDSPDGWKPIGDVTLSPSTVPIVIGDPRYRSRGYGTRTLALLIGRARALGWQKLVTHPISLLNERSLRMFERAGFVRRALVRDADGEVGVTMERTLGEPTAGIEIETERLRLRPLSPTHTAGYAGLLADPRVHPFVVEDGPVDPDDIPARIARKQQQWREGTGATWAVLRDDTFIGYVALHGLGKPRVAISYAVSPDAQRQGYGREAVRAVLAHASDLGCEHVEARVHHGNEASATMLLAAGFAELEPVLDPPRRVFEWTRLV